MADSDIGLMAHLFRRAGFGATRDELEAYCAKGYEATVKEMLQPEKKPAIERDLMYRYMPEYLEGAGLNDPSSQAWVHMMINTQRPLEEKVALFGEDSTMLIVKGICLIFEGPVTELSPGIESIAFCIKVKYCVFDLTCR